MTTAHEHYREAERLLAGKPADYVSQGGEHVTAFPPSRMELAAAQVHATLALAATMGRWDQGSAGEPVVGSGEGGNAAPTRARPAGPDPQDTCQVGDPDPTPWGPEWPDDEAPMCGYQWPDHFLGVTWTCTRDNHQIGQHVAGDGAKVAAVRPQSTPDGGVS